MPECGGRGARSDAEVAQQAAPLDEDGKR